MSEPPRLLDRVRQAVRVRHYSRRTEEAYVGWIRRFILFHNKRHPSAMGAAEVNAFLTNLAVSENVASSTQAQALCALLFLYKHVLGEALPWLEDVVHARKPRKLPVVLTRDEVREVLGRLDGTPKLVVSLLYGAGLRLLEALRLRVKDLDFPARILTVREGKGAKDRRTMLPPVLSDPLQDHLRAVRALHVGDLARGCGDVWLPHALAAKYPSAGKEWIWQYVFPAHRLSVDPRSGIVRRHHVDESGIQRAVRAAACHAGLEKPVGCHTFRHRLPRICWRMGTTFGPSRSCSATRT